MFLEDECTLMTKKVCIELILQDIMELNHLDKKKLMDELNCSGLINEMLTDLYNFILQQSAGILLCLDNYPTEKKIFFEAIVSEDISCTQFLSICENLLEGSKEIPSLKNIRTVVQCGLNLKMFLNGDEATIIKVIDQKGYQEGLQETLCSEDFDNFYFKVKNFAIELSKYVSVKGKDFVLSSITLDQKKEVKGIYRPF